MVLREICKRTRLSWIFAISINLLSLAWFGDLLHALDVRDHADQATMQAAFIGSQHYAAGHRNSRHIEHQTQIYLNQLRDRSGFEFLEIAKVNVVADPVTKQIRVEIAYQMPTNYLRLVGVSHWPIKSNTSIGMTIGGETGLEAI